MEAGELQPGTAVRLSFRLPVSGTAINADGVVVWADNRRQGIQFTKVSAQNQQSIRDFMVAVEK